MSAALRSLTALYSTADEFRDIEIHTLDLSSNNFDNGALKALAGVLPKLGQLSYLRLDDNALDLCEDSPPTPAYRPQSVKAIGWQNGNKVCEWFHKPGTYAFRYAGDWATKLNLTAAQETCLQLGASVCRAVTCEKGTCTLRAAGSVTPTPSGKGEDSYVPAPVCYQDGLFSFVSNLTLLKTLLVRGNRLCTPGLAALAANVAGLRRLAQLDVSAASLHGVPKAAMVNFAESLPKRTTHLNISNNNLTMDSLLTLTNSTTKSLKSLSASSVGLTPGDDYLELGRTLGTFKNLLVLELAENHIGDSGLEALGRSMPNNERLCSLNLQRTDITGSGFQNFAEKFPPNYPMQLINVADNKMGKEGLEAALRFTAMKGYVGLSTRKRWRHKACKDMRFLDLTNASLGDEGARHLAFILNQQNTPLGKLQEIRVASNGISREGMSRLLDAARRCKWIRGLYLASNELKSPSGPSEPDPTVGVLGIPNLPSSGNRTGGAGLLQKVAGMKKLQTVDWSHNEADLADIRKLCLETEKLEHLYIRNVFSRPPIGFLQEWDFILEAKNLKTLDIGQNNLDMITMDNILEKAADLDHLTTLVVDGNEFSVKGMERAMQKHSPFRSLKELRGDFSPCHARTLRALIPRAMVISTEK